MPIMSTVEVLKKKLDWLRFFYQFGFSWINIFKDLLELIRSNLSVKNSVNVPVF